MKKNKIIYYSDEINDDFAGTKIEKKVLPEDYEYLNKGFWCRIRRFLIYNVIVQPVTVLWTRVIKRAKYVNKKALKPYKNRGCFMYGNHTAMVMDAFDPSYLAYPRSADVIVNADAVSIKGLGWLVKTLGGFPIPEGYTGMKKFNAAIKEAIDKRHWVAIYPEAHIWHYYTKIRNFPAVSFGYPVKLGTPVFSYTMTYKKRKHRKYPRRVIYVDGPFFPDKNLPYKEAVKKLRDEVYAAMCVRAKNSDCEFIKYVYRPAEEGDK